MWLWRETYEIASKEKEMNNDLRAQDAQANTAETHENQTITIRRALPNGPMMRLSDRIIAHLIEARALAHMKRSPKSIPNRAPMELEALPDDLGSDQEYVRPLEI